MANDISNPILAEAEQTIESNLQPAMHDAYLKIVVAGLHILLDKGDAGFMAKLKSSKDPIGDCGRGAASLVMIMRKQAQGVMPMKAAIPAGMTLMIHGLDFVSRANIAKVDAPDLANAAQVYTDTLFAKLGITPSVLHQAIARAHAATQNPAVMAQVNRRAGAAPTGSLINGGVQ